MRIPKLHSLILLWLVVLLASACRTKSVALEDLQGTWTRETYIETVRSTRSPFAESPETVVIEDGKLIWTNYHEGSWRKVVRVERSGTKGLYRLLLGEWEAESPSSDLAEMPFKRVIDHDGRVVAITFLDDAIVQNKQEPFVKISLPLEQLVAQIVLVGSYADEQGQTYSFDESGVAHWPGVSFSYEVALDSFMASCDYFFCDYETNPVNTKTYGFKWDNGTVALFNTKDEDSGLICDGPPIAVLTPESR